MTFLYYMTILLVYLDNKVYIVLHSQYFYRAILTTKGPEEQENKILR